MTDWPKVRQGVYLAEGRARFDEVHKIGSEQIRVVLTQGIKRQVRRVLASLGYRVRRLQRIRIGPLMARGLEPGEFRELRPEEVAALQKPARSGSKSASQGHSPEIAGQESLKSKID
jgi:23S rRNA pseudouridine2605 synthase